MSHQSRQWARMQNLPPIAKSILNVLAQYADEGGVAFRTIPNLIQDVGCSRSTVFNCLGMLKRAGVIEEVQAGRGRGNATTYRLCFERNLDDRPRLTPIPEKGPNGPIAEKVQSAKKVQSPDEKGPIPGRKRSNPQHHIGGDIEREIGGVISRACEAQAPSATNIVPFPALLADDNHPPPVASDEQVFDQFWLRYPRKVGKGQARSAWARACKRVRRAGLNPSVIVQGLADRLPFFRTDIEFIKHPTTWLNGDCWDDDLASLRAEAGQRAASGGRRGFVTDRERRDAEAKAWRARQPPSEWDEIEAAERAASRQDQPDEPRFVINQRGEPQ